MSKHYTIDKSAEGIARDDRTCHDGPFARHVYIVGHSLGGGVTRHIVELEKGDTADNPLSTKRPIYGPGFIVYDCHKTGITVREFDDAEGFYDAFKTPMPRESVQAVLGVSWDDKQREFNQILAEQGEAAVEGHIFADMQKVAFWLAADK